MASGALVGALRRIWRALCGIADALGCEQALGVGKGCRVMAGGQAAIAQLVARGSHNPKVVSSILTGRISFDCFANMLKLTCSSVLCCVSFE